MIVEKTSVLRCLKRFWLWLLIGLPAFAVHAGTAILRLSTFFPYPRLLDFSAFYAAAWALRRGLGCYDLPLEFLQFLQVEQDIPFPPPPIYNPPIWPWLLQPLTFLRFPLAATAWLVINLGLLAWCAKLVARIAGYRGWKAWAIIGILLATFGPIFLDLTLGQTSILLLAAALVAGQSLHTDLPPGFLQGAIAYGVASGAKLFPLLWLPVLAVQRHWKRLATWALGAAIFLGASFLIAPRSNKVYWTRLLWDRVDAAAEQGGMDDQSLTAWLDRLGRDQVYQVPGIRSAERTQIEWHWLWSFDAQTIRLSGYGISALLILVALVVAFRAPQTCAEGTLYLWLTVVLVVFPHMERYNHALLVPAMIWLWRQNGWSRHVVVGAYALTALSRLNHLWLVALPVPWAPLASGFGTCAALLLAVGLGAFIFSHPASRTLDPGER